MRKRSTALTLVAMMAMTTGVAAHANGTEGPNKVWLCHFEENHDAAQPDGSYLDDRNGGEPGFWGPTPDGEHLTGDYIVKWNDTESGLNSGQVSLCTGNGGEFLLVSVNAIGTDETPRGHRAQNLFRISTYPDGYKG